MAQIKYDVSDVEAGGGGEQPPPGLYSGTIAGITHRSKSKNGDTSDLEVILDVGQEYARLWYYVMLPDAPNYDQKSHGWKLREFTDALGLPPKGALPANLKTFNGKPVNVKVVADTDLDGEYRGKAKNIFLPTDDAKKVAPSNGGDKVEAADDEGPYGREEIETWTDDDLKGYAEELGVDVPTGRGWKNKLIDALVEAEEGDGDGDAEAEASGSGVLDGVEEEFLNELNSDESYYADWTDEDIKWLIEGLGIGGNVATSGRGWKAKAIAEFVSLAGDGDGTVADEDKPDYSDESEWPTDRLKEEIANRNEEGAEISISGRATRAKMIEALEADDANANDPF